jgi:hypothetical protein
VVSPLEVPVSDVDLRKVSVYLNPSSVGHEVFR